jgi:ABC-type glycerol-3-phosphate transport system permease component
MHLRLDVIIIGLLLAVFLKLQVLGTVLVLAALPYEWIIHAAPWSGVRLRIQMVARLSLAAGGLAVIWWLNLPILGAVLVLATVPYTWVYDGAAFGAATLRSQLLLRGGAAVLGLGIGVWGFLFVLLNWLQSAAEALKKAGDVAATFQPYDLLSPGIASLVDFLAAGLHVKDKAVFEVAAGCGWALLFVGGVLVLASLPYLLTFRLLRGAAEGAGRGRHLTGEERAALAFTRATDPRRRLQRRLAGMAASVAKHAVIWIVLAFAFLPLYLMLIVSLKSNTQFYQAPAQLTAPYHFENWTESWNRIMPTVANSIFISIAATSLTLMFAVCAAYFFARQKMPMSTFLWNAILVLMMMPMIANLMPLFILLRDMSLLNTLTALIIVGASAGQVFSIFVLRSFVADIPQDLFEAADIDGANHFQQIRTIVLPLAAPILGTVGVMQFIALWNDFVLPLIVIRDHAQLPVMVELLRLSGEYIKYWGPMMAGYTIASIPVVILFVFSMRLFIRGLTEGAIKG